MGSASYTSLPGHADIDVDRCNSRLDSTPVERTADTCARTSRAYVLGVGVGQVIFGLTPM